MPRGGGDRRAARASARGALAALAAERAARVRAAAWAPGGGARDVFTADLRAFARFDRGGLVADLAFEAPGAAAGAGMGAGAGAGAGAAPGAAPWALGEEALALTRANMRALYDAAGGEWAWDDAAKRAELAHAEARLVAARDARGALLGFVAFRFVSEGPLEALYVYELQLAPEAQGKGLGKHLMQVCELAARKQGMHA